MLVLLVIFMITAPLLTQGIRVDLPRLAAEPLPQDLIRDNKPLVLTVDAEGRMYLNIGEDPEEALASPVVVARAAAVLIRKPETPVLVRASEQVPYGDVVTVMGLLVRAGANKVGLVTRPASHGRMMDRLKALFERALKVLKQGANPRAPGANPHNLPLPLLRPFTYSLMGHTVVRGVHADRLCRAHPSRTNRRSGPSRLTAWCLNDEAVKQEIQRLDDLERAAIIEREQEVEALRKQIEEQEQRQKRQEQELSALSSQTEQARQTFSEQQTQASRQLSEMQKRQQEEAARLERTEGERKKEEERAKAAEAERRKAEEERKKAEAETRKLSAEAEAAQRQLEETEQKKREAELAEQMQREMAQERRRKAEESGLLDEYKARIRQRIESNWLRPASTREDLIWVVLLDMLPGNEVGDNISFEQFNGTETDRRSIEAAIRRSSPLA